MIPSLKKKKTLAQICPQSETFILTWMQRLLLWKDTHAMSRISCEHFMVISVTLNMWQSSISPSRAVYSQVMNLCEGRDGHTFILVVDV